MYQENKALGMYIEKYRKNKKISLKELDEKIHVDATLIDQIENGEVAHLAEFVKICRALNISFYTLPCECVESNDEEIISMLTKLSEQDKEVIQIVISRILESKSID